MTTNTTAVTHFVPGDATTHNGITVVPLFPSAQPVVHYITLGQAVAHGLSISEVDTDGDVGELLVHNPTSHRVLLYDGEELEGAKQNRILNVSVLVEAGATLAVPVSCIEAGRWHCDDADFTFRAAQRTTSPSVRMAKEAQLRVAPMQRGVAQNAVWDAVRHTHHQHASHSDTDAYSDAVRHERPRLDALRAEFPRQPGQCGVMLGYRGDVVCMDVVSRPDAYEHLHDALLTGYLLDGLMHQGHGGISGDQAEEFVATVAGATVSQAPSAGLGSHMRLTADTATGTGLYLDGETLQLTAFRTQGQQPPVARHARIARPMRRRMG